MKGESQGNPPRDGDPFPAARPQPQPATLTSGKQSLAKMWSSAVFPHWLSPTTTILHFTFWLGSMIDLLDNFWLALLSFIDLVLFSSALCVITSVPVIPLTKGSRLESHVACVVSLVSCVKCFSNLDYHTLDKSKGLFCTMYYFIECSSIYLVGFILPISYRNLWCCVLLIAACKRSIYLSHYWWCQLSSIC